MRIRFRLSLTLASLLIITSLSTTILAILWVSGKQAAQEVGKSLFEVTSQNVETKVSALLEHSLEIAKIVSSRADLQYVSGDGPDMSVLPLFRSILEADKTYYSIYKGFEDGSFLQLIAVNDRESIAKAHNAPAGTAWIARTILSHSIQERTQNWAFLDADFKQITRRVESTRYDPRQRPWYKSAMQRPEGQLSEVYSFHSLQQPGLTASHKITGAIGVVGVDLTLSGLGEFVSGEKVSENGVVILYDRHYRIIAASDSIENVGVLSPLQDASRADIKYFSEQKDVGFRSFGVNGQTYLANIVSLDIASGALNIAVSAPLDDFRQSFISMKKRIFILTLISFAIFIPASLIFSDRLSSRVRRLVKQAKMIKQLEFVESGNRESHIVEFFELENSFDEMRKSLAENAGALTISQEKLNRLVELGIAMSAERDTDKVMEMVLMGAKELSNADGGTLYKIEDNALSFKIVHNTSLDIQMGGTSGVEPVLSPVPLFNDAGEENHHNIVSHTVHRAMSVNIEDAYNNDLFDFSGTKVFDEMNGYRSKSFLTVPLKPRGGDAIGALQIINAQDENGDIIPFSDEIQSFVEALSAQAATILYNHDLLDAQERLMDAMIQLIAGAIDAKSPYTGGHCERVPELAIMLAREACEKQDGIYADFNFETEEQWREFSIGAWLHDCGKVITPEYVVDKATKLETIYNRIHEIRTRFEVLLRDAEIAYYKERVSGADINVAQERFDKRKAKLIDDFAFVAECNVGGEFMSDDKLERLKNIAEETWVRHFDIQQGLSHEEAQRFQNVAVAPAVEKLLEDKPYHIIPRQSDVTAQYEHLNFKVPVPQDLYNRGELYNLSIGRGTLTPEEHFKIKEHIMQTIAMLEALPFPAHLQRVPEYAGTHHETMIGTGYPRKLESSELSIPSRIMAIADIFEALTASDRPYKKAKTLSESIKILSFFKKDQHIDGDIFDLFLTSGVYKDYAEKFLLPEQIDHVDISQYLS